MDTLAALDQATKRFRRTEAAHNEARDAVLQAVLDALRDDQQPTVVADRSPFSPAYIRRIAREHGIEPAKPGPKRSTGREVK